MPRLKFAAWRVWLDCGPEWGTIAVETTGTGAESVARSWENAVGPLGGWTVILVERI